MTHKNEKTSTYPEELVSFVNQHSGAFAYPEKTKLLLSLAGSLPMDFDEDKQMESKLKDYESHA
jgi:hypothetical protein